MEIQSGSIEARSVRNQEIEEHLKNFSDEGEFIRFCGAAFGIEQRVLNNGVASGTTSSGAATGGICTIKDSNETDIRMLIPIENAVEYKVVNDKSKDRSKDEKNKEKEGIGE